MLKVLVGEKSIAGAERVAEKVYIERNRSPQRLNPDFLPNLLVLANFMRLSLMKAAHVDAGGAPWQEIREAAPILQLVRTV